MLQYMEGLADDALTDQFGIIFPNGVPGGGNSELLRLRMDMSFDEPEKTLASYEVNFEGVKIPKLGSEETDKTFNLSFRVDNNRKVYKALKDWWYLCFNPMTGAVGPEATTRTTMILVAYGPPNKSIKYQKEFHGVKLKSFKVTTYDYSNKGEPIRVECSFIYAYEKEITH